MLQNLLSKRAKRNLRKEYYTRLVVVGVSMLALAVVVGLVSLLPAYMSVVGDLGFSETEQEAKKKDVQDNKELLAEVAQGEQMVTFLEEDLQKEKLTELVREAFQQRPEGVIITGFSYSRERREFTLEGIASTRDLVVPYARALEATQHFVSAPVNIADLAKNTNLEFHLSLGIADDVDTEDL